jgi:hypothetical protein
MNDRLTLQKQVKLADRIVLLSTREATSVDEITFYPSDFPIILRERMQGKTIGEAAACFGLQPNQFVRLLEGQWRPSKEICRRMGLKIVYAISGTSSRECEKSG